MYSARGIGLAAIQIGVPKRIIVMDLSKEENKKLPMYFVISILNQLNLDKIRNKLILKVLPLKV